MSVVAAARDGAVGCGRSWWVLVRQYGWGACSLFLVSFSSSVVWFVLWLCVDGESEVSQSVNRDLFAVLVCACSCCCCSF